MTESDAIEAIQFDLKIGGEIHSQVLRDAVDVAIQALEEVQARDKKVWHHSYEIPDKDDCYIVAWLPKGEQSIADTPHYYEIGTYENDNWSIDGHDDLPDGEWVLLAWMELPNPYYKECEKNEVIDTDNVVERLKKASYERFGNNGMGGELVVNLDDAIEIIKAGGEE